jgi:hypothetical protein
MLPSRIEMAIALAPLVVAALSVTTGCASQPRARPRLVPDEQAGACPLGIREAVVIASDVPGGVDVIFTSDSSSRVDEIRIRVRDVAMSHGPSSHAGLGHDGEHRQNHGHGLKLSEAPRADVLVEDVESGTRLRLVAVDPGARDALRARIHQRIEELRTTPCD